MTSREQIEKKIEELVTMPSYIYVLCMMIITDLTCDLYNMSVENPHERILPNEFAILISMLFRNPIDLSYPPDAEVFMEYKSETYNLLKELHNTFIDGAMSPLLGNEIDSKTASTPLEAMFGASVEAMQYSGEGLYPFQYLDFLVKKYQYDEKYLAKQHGFKISTAKSQLEQIENIYKKKVSKVNFLNRKKLKQTIETDMKDKVQEEKDIYEFQHYLYQFNEIALDDQGLYLPFNKICQRILNILCLSPKDLEEYPELQEFMDKFEFNINKRQESDTISNLLQYKINPIFKLSDGAYFIPLLSELYRAIYESPFYWMEGDIEYRDTASKNRGLASERIIEDMLRPVFGQDYVYRSVKLRKGRNDVSDIDVLCVLEEYAIIVQIKSKKLTHLAQHGDFQCFQRDIKKAFQEAYEQGVKCRKGLFDDNVKLFDEQNQLITLTPSIKEAFILCITTENIASISSITQTHLKKSGDDPNPVMMSMFDLELFTHYLDNPFSFMLYMIKRTRLGSRIHALNEISVLAWHLKYSLNVPKEVTDLFIDQSCALNIDQDFLAFKSNNPSLRIKEKICTPIGSPSFIKLCSEIMNLDFPEKVDLIFTLYDLNDTNKDKLINRITEIKRMAKKDYQIHKLSMSFRSDQLNSGITYIASRKENFHELKEELRQLCEFYKYENKSDYWIGLGSFAEYDNFISFSYLDTLPWKYAQEMEEKLIYHKALKIKRESIKKKVGRNEKCPCGSGLKYKKCCGLCNIDNKTIDGGY
jgi:hypothetical protein